MCGFAGIVQKEVAPLDKGLLETLLARLQHRGPDDTGILSLAGRQANRHSEARAISADTVLLFKRLAILDLSDSGAQPMSLGERYHMVFNGEIYNYKELRVELEREGCEFVSDSDSEVLLQGFVHWGEAVVPRLVGMFAFIIVDTVEQTVFLARDPFGIKPLYYVANRERFAFASEIKVLLELPQVSRRANPQRLYEYLSFAISDYGEDTMFADVKQLSAGHTMTLNKRTLQRGEQRAYRHFSPEHNTDIGFEEAATRLRELFFENVALHMRSDVPVGMTLSGGIDSSAIASVMRHLKPDTSFEAFSFIANEPSLSEEAWVDLVARRKNLTVHKTMPSADDLAQDLSELVRLQDEPFANPSIFAQFHVFKLVQRCGLKVMLDGQGADEMLAGYPPYLGALFTSFLQRGELKSAAQTALAGAKRAGFKNMALYAGSFSVPEKYQALPRRLFGFDLMPTWLEPGWFAERGVTVSNVAFSDDEPNGGKSSLRSNLRYALEVTLPPLLRWQDRNSMAHSVESRVPFLTQSMTDFLLSLPEHYLLAKDGTSKSVFRRAMRGVVPDEILDRRDKVGFATPRETWLKELNPWVSELFESERLRNMPMVKEKRVLSEWHRVAAEDQAFRAHIWRQVNLVAWAQELELSFD